MAEPLYLGNGATCYSNSLLMCLRTREKGASSLPEAGFVECLTTMPFGNLFLAPPEGPRIFFSSPKVTPDAGLERAVHALGWSWKVEHAPTPKKALTLLRGATVEGPALAGPLDLGLLKYNPNFRHLEGVDHYVAVISVEEDAVSLHDPEGFPYATLSTGEFLEAWRAERIGFAHDAFTLRHAFHRLAKPTRTEMIRSAMPQIRENLTANPGGPVAYGGPEAIRRYADSVRLGVSPEMAAFQTFVAYPLACRRSADAAMFLQEAGNEELARLTAAKARWFGCAQYAAVRERWEEVADLLERIAALEERIVTEVGGPPTPPPSAPLAG